MKTIRTTVLCVCITLYNLSSFAQEQKILINEPDYNKPKLFSHLPDKIPVSIEKSMKLLLPQSDALLVSAFLKLRTFSLMVRLYQLPVNMAIASRVSLSVLVLMKVQD